MHKKDTRSDNWLCVLLPIQSSTARSFRHWSKSDAPEIRANSHLSIKNYGEEVGEIVVPYVKSNFGKNDYI